MMFNVYLLCSYNKHFNNLMIDCPCYDSYRTEEAFTESVILNRGSYMACLCYESSMRNRISHRSVPIIIGSYIDFRIRGREAVIESAPLWGLVILRGLLKMYSNFSTFDALSMHVRETKKLKSIDWYTYIGEDGLALNYSNKVVTCTYKKITSNQTDWAQLLQDSNPFKTTVLQSDYIKMFDTILQYPYSMNDLKNRQILNGPVVIHRYVEYDLSRRLKNKIASIQKMATVFEKGGLFQALSKKNTFETEEWCRNYPQNYDNTMHEGRSNKAAHLLPTVIRASNAAVRNSNALSFPNDAIGYYCLLNTKDLKSAGEQNVLSDFVIMCEETNQLDLYDYIKKIATGLGEILTIDGYLINCLKKWSLCDLIRVKCKFPHVTTQYNLPYVRFSTRANIPIKYSEQYDVFFSPAETTHFQITYPEIDMLSITAKELSISSLIKTPPSKSTVSINNIKGSVARITSKLHKQLMENSLGVTCYIDITDEEINKQIDEAVLPGRGDVGIFNTHFKSLDKAFNLNEFRNEKFATTSPKKAMEALFRMYPPNHLLAEHSKISNTPFKRQYNIASTNTVSEYYSVIFSPNHYKAPSIWNLRLRAAFGNPNGGCIEDGVVIDSNILKTLPSVYYNACITVDFTFKTVKQPKEAKFIAINEKYGTIEDEALIGCLVTEHEVYVKNSKHTKVLRPEKIGSHYFYLINFLPKKSKMYDNLKVRHIYNGNMITVVITGQTKVDIMIGSKVANSFGQKNVISMEKDLRDCWGVTRDGRRVHAQIIYSEVSLIGRVTSGQLHSMFMSNELAFGEDGTIIAPVDLVLHTLHPYTNIKLIKVKNDTLTNINGFDSQNLSYTSKMLRSDEVYENVVHILGLHGYDVDFNVISKANPEIVNERNKILHSTNNKFSNNNDDDDNDNDMTTIDDVDDMTTIDDITDCGNVDDENIQDDDDGGGGDNCDVLHTKIKRRKIICKLHIFIHIKKLQTSLYFTCVCVLCSIS
ncbi:LEF-8 [Mauternbach virus]|uniref:LEF-8 n=1 Tax=Mauternbach virus TaxID=2486603 RepID=A0A3G3E7I3_9VIRU|nr:LEF-8 [Mauternbach virus]AYP97895.1 LEF-8 [Mauternbach virus]